MKTKEQCIKWCELMLGYHPNTEDKNFLNSIIHHLDTESLITDITYIPEEIDIEDGRWSNTQ